MENLWLRYVYVGNTVLCKTSLLRQREQLLVLGSGNLSGATGFISTNIKQLSES